MSKLKHGDRSGDRARHVDRRDGGAGAANAAQDDLVRSTFRQHDAIWMALEKAFISRKGFDVTYRLFRPARPRSRRSRPAKATSS